MSASALELPGTGVPKLRPAWDPPRKRYSHREALGPRRRTWTPGPTRISAPENRGVEGWRGVGMSEPWHLGSSGRISGMILGAAKT